MSDISFLPEQLKEKENTIKQSTATTVQVKDLSMHMPDEEMEDIEIIEVDETEVEQLLAKEPLYTKIYYKVSLLADELKTRYLQPRKLETISKVPPFEARKKPEFFKAPAMAAKTETAVTVAAPVNGKPPQTEPVSLNQPVAVPRPMATNKIRAISGAGKRVRIIKRIRKPVQISLLNEELMHELRVNVPRRKFTLAFLTVLFAVVFGSAYFLLHRSQASAQSDIDLLHDNLAELRGNINAEEQKWQSFRDLEPRLLALNGLLDNRVYNSKILTFFEEHALQDVQYQAMSVGLDGTIGIGLEAGSMEAAARQLMIFQQAPQIEQALTTAFSQEFDEQGNAKVIYQIQLKLKKEAFK